MTTSTPSSNAPSGTSTPNPAASRFTSQNSTAEDLLKSQTVGLVHLSDFRKRRAEALEQKEREAQDRSLGRFALGRDSGTVTPQSDEASKPQVPAKQKKKRKVAGGKLSFGVDEEEQGDGEGGSSGVVSGGTPTSRSMTPEDGKSRNGSVGAESDTSFVKKRLRPNAGVSVAPKVMTKSALLREAQTREQLRKEFLAMQEAVKTTEIQLPFVFYDGTNIPGGVCRVKKGDHAWFFLDKARKVGAELGVGGSGERANSRREWARVGVDDLMLVRGEVIIPHHYDFYYFIVNKTKGPLGIPLFDFSTEADRNSTPSTPSGGLSKPVKKASGANTPLDESLEGARDDPNMTKVVDRRWYERNKHIFPASVWEEFDPEKDYSTAIRRDAGGNAFFFT